MANWRALHGTTLSAETMFLGNNPAAPSRSTPRQTCAALGGLVVCTIPDLSSMLLAGPRTSPMSWMMVLARSRGATAVLATMPANPAGEELLPPLPPRLDVFPLGRSRREPVPHRVTRAKLRVGE